MAGIRGSRSGHGRAKVAPVSQSVTLHLRQEGERVLVDVKNGTRDAVTLVTHPRYLAVELLDARGQFVGGEGAPTGLPGKKDFVTVDAGARAEAVFALELSKDGDTVTVGDTSFAKAPPATEVRVVYKPDALVPNQPKRGLFFRGPVTSDRLAI